MSNKMDESIIFSFSMMTDIEDSEQQVDMTINKTVYKKGEDTNLCYILMFFREILGSLGYTDGTIDKYIDIPS